MRITKKMKDESKTKAKNNYRLTSVRDERQLDLFPGDIKNECCENCVHCTIEFQNDPNVKYCGLMECKVVRFFICDKHEL